MKIEKLSNSTYRMRKMYKGKTYTVITDYKPTQKEAVLLMAEKMKEVTGQPGNNHTFGDCARSYIQAKDNVLSPSTIRGYDSILKNIPEDFKNMIITDIEMVDIQRYINQHASTHAAKTTKNLYEFILPVFEMFRPAMKLNITLPKKENEIPVLLSEENVFDILNKASGTKYEIPIMLAMYGLRRSEICALVPGDLNGVVLTICKAKVQDKNKEWIIRKINKTDKSYRKVTISSDLSEKIRQSDVIYDGTPDSLSSAFKRFAKSIGYEKASLHKMRSFFASYAHSIGISEADILALGGWSSPNIMKSVYRHSMEKKRKESNDKLNNGFGNIISGRLD